MKGKIFGALIGFVFGRFWGAVIGAILGHIFIDRRRRQRGPNLFFHATFAVMGHIAKSNGQVTQADIQLASSLMDGMGLTGAARQAAQQAYRDGKEADYPLQLKLKQLGLLLRWRRDLARVFLEIQIQAALTDGSMSDKEQQILGQIAKELGFSAQELEQLIAMRQGQNHGQQQGVSVEDACKILGVSLDDELNTIKRAYRKLMAQHHPDKLASQGLPPEMAEMAAQKSRDIQSAWEVLREAKQA